MNSYIKTKLRQKAYLSYNFYLIKISDWCTETGQEVDFYFMTSVELAEKLRHFYAVAKPRKETDYHRNSLKNLRAALNRHLRDIGRDIDIVRDREFQKANAVLNGFLKLQAKSGKAKPTAHKPIIEAGDFPKIKQYLQLDSPISVLYRAWYLIAFILSPEAWNFTNNCWSQVLNSRLMTRVENMLL